MIVTEKHVLAREEVLQQEIQHAQDASLLSVHIPEIPYDDRIILQDIQQLFNLRLCELAQSCQQKECSKQKEMSVLP